ncbi:MULTISPECIES: TetR/AcrR family transcriptional regulator [Streptomyces]|uniref:TetR/AcrR family transcriptional regulator n=1 Tax=Streptomyces TaxID=1883 RepID=UPI0008988AFE|nr:MULTISPECIES: TetR/AcrR family transcriptional regulator [unclassified Streptomyces]SEB61385.1 transcriptional regulator, TetR family [Streptomyces sp. PAN_FS17]SEE32447.1 transcriptional regulator, TetR family [Streptomyces sp. KS_5]
MSGIVESAGTEAARQLPEQQGKSGPSEGDGGQDRTMRRALLDAALEVFTERGYTDAGLSEISARCGIPVGSLFQHYGGKRGLYLALWEEFREEQERRTAATLAAERGRGVDDPVALFVAGATAYLEGVWDNRRLGALLVDDDAPAGFDALRRQWDRAWVRRNARLLKVDERRRAGRVRVSVLTTVIGGAARELGDCGDETEAREIVDEVCGILIHLSAPPG